MANFAFYSPLMSLSFTSTEPKKILSGHLKDTAIHMSGAIIIKVLRGFCMALLSSIYTTCNVLNWVLILSGLDYNQIHTVDLMCY